MMRTNNSSAESTPYSKIPLWLTAFWSGAAIMAFELAGARLLTPVFGMSIEVWAAVIATTLGCLAIGYWVGGKIADTRSSVVTLTAVLLLACISLLFVWYFGQNIPVLFTNMSLVSGAWFSAGAILAMPLFLLGIVQPLLARLLLLSTSHTGTVVGGLLAAGTFGGVLGTVLTALVLIPHVGISRTLFLLISSTVVIIVVVIAGNRRWTSALCVLTIGAAAGYVGLKAKSSAPKIGPMQVLQQVEGLYGDLEVLEYHGTRALVCDGVFQTVLPSSGISKGTLIRARDYTELIPYLRPQVCTALLIGIGGALHEKALWLYGIEVHGIEIEPAAIPLTAKYFGLASEVTVADGRAFLVRNQRRFDAIVIDAFLGSTVPEHLYTTESFQLIDKHLNPDGVLAIHLTGHPKHPATCAVARTLKEVFPHTLFVQSGISNELQHMYLFASKAPLRLQQDQCIDLEIYGFTGQEFCTIDTNDAVLLTDDKSPLTMLSRDIMAQHRRYSLELRRKPLW